MTPELREALNNVYSVFARYKDDYGFARRSGVSHALNNLTHDDWGRMNREFDMEVLLYEGDLFRHFLPRFLEWMREDEKEMVISFNWLWWDVSAHLQLKGWRNWPSEEVEALRAVFEAWTRQSLAEHRGQMPLEFLLRIEDDLSRYLDVWLQARPLEVTSWLWTVNWNHNENARRWATQLHVEEQLEAAFFAHPEGEHAALLSRSIQLLCSLRAFEHNSISS